MKPKTKAEQELRETRNYLENLINYANAPIIVWDPAFRITRFNHAFEHLTGYKSGDVMGEKLSILFPDASRKESMGRIKVTSGGEYWESVEIPILCKDGSVRVALWNSANIYAEDGKTLVSTIAQGTDITESKQAEMKLTNLYAKSEESRKSLLSILEDVTEKEQALQKSEEKFKTVADLTYSWEYWIDPDRNFIYISPSCERISGYKPEEFSKDPELMEKIIYSEDKKKVINHKKIESDSKKAGNVDFRIITRNGDIRYIEHVCCPVYGKDGNYLGRRATNRDITDNRRQETIRQMMYQISNAVNTTKDLSNFFKVIHLELGIVLKTKNFYIALYNKETDTLSLPYFIDEKDDFKTFPARKTLTAYVIKNKKAVILKEKEIKKLISSGEIEAVGTICKIWLGVPLISKEEVTGVLAVQSYENEKDFNRKDLELLKFISGQIGLSIERKQSEEELTKHREHLEELVKERTKELEEKNKELKRFNNLFVDREFRIKDLKDKIKELEGKK